MTHSNGTARVVDVTLSVLVVVALIYQISTIWVTFQSSLAFYYAHLGIILSISALALFRTHVFGKGVSVGQRLFRGVLFLTTLIAVVVTTSYFNLNSTEVEFRQPFITNTDFTAGVVLIGAVLVLSWYVWGKILTGAMILAIAYYGFGEYLPGFLSYATPEKEFVVTNLAGIGSSRGLLWGIPLSANVIFLIIVYGGALRGARVLAMFNEIGLLLTSLVKGGVCYSAILAATAIGMVTGQPVANVALAGSMTIPSMKKQGLSGESAGSLVTLASLGSQLIPPIMGLGGFLIAVNLGIPYVEVAAAAIVPAVLYMLMVVIATYFVVNTQVTLTKVEEKVDTRLIWWVLPSFLSSFIVLIYLLYQRYSPEYAAMWALGLLLLGSFARPRAYRPSIAEMFDGIRFGVLSAAQLALILAGIGLVVQVLITTGAGFDLGRAAMGIAGDSVLLTLIFAMMLSLFAGLGLPTPAAYALIAIIAIPFLVNLNVDPMAAHFFGFYFAVFSAITPPVAVACMAAARIADASFYRTVLYSGKIAIITILIPFSFIAFPSLLKFPHVGINGIIAAIALLASTALWAASLYGWLGVKLARGPRVVFGLAPVAYICLLVTKDMWIAAIPVGMLVAVYVLRKVIPRVVVADDALDVLPGQATNNGKQEFALSSPVVQGTPPTQQTANASVMTMHRTDTSERKH